MVSTVHAAYDAIIHAMSSAAQDHVGVADALTSQVVEVLRSVGKKSEESKKKVLNSPPVLPVDPGLGAEWHAWGRNCSSFRRFWRIGIACTLNDKR